MMKVHVKNPELVLLFGLDRQSPKGQKVIGVLEKLAIPYRMLSDKMLGETLGFVAELPGYEAAEQPYEGEDLAEEVLLMKGLKDSRMNLLLSSLREVQASIRLKAVVTNHNRDWRLYELFHELIEEHETIGAYNQLRQAYALACGRDMSALPEAERQEWSVLLLQAKALIESREPAKKSEYLKAAQRLAF